MMMLLLVLFSGLLNLSAQVLYQKVVSVTLGDLYATFMLVTLTFIAGSAIGNILSTRLRKYLPLLEMLTGFYNILLYTILSGPFYQLNLPSHLVVLGLALPAFTLGTQLPLYSYYMRKIRFSGIYFLYHLGAILGLFLFEFYFTEGNSIRSALLNLGFAQIALGLILVFSAQDDRYHIQQAPAISWKNIFSKHSLLPTSVVFVVSSLSFYQIFWALKTQTFFTEAFRLQATTISMAVFAWMSLAGIGAKLTKRTSLYILIFLWAASLLVVQLLFSAIPIWITDQMNGELGNYFLLSFALALFLTAPVLFSSSIFIRGTEELHRHLPIDQASGYLNAVASVGNIAGMACATLMAAYFWNHQYFAAAAVFASATILVTANFERKYFHGAITILVLVSIAYFAFQKEQKNYLLVNRIPKDLRTSPPQEDVQVYSQAFSSIIIHTLAPKEGRPFYQRQYYVDGHRSHDMNLATENLVGLLAAKYFPTKINRSAVIGVGSGQTSWGVAAISDHTDLVEISPAVKDNLSVFKIENNDLAHRKNVQIHLQDGMNFLRKCPSNPYDLIVNTSTYPGNFNAAKLFTDEFLEIAKTCLRPEGVYQTYFDIASVTNLQQMAEFLAPIRRHFKYIDLILIPYPIVIAYNQDRTVRIGDISEYLNNIDREFYKQLVATKFFLREPCTAIYRNIPPLQSPRMNTLDQSILEANSIENIVKALNPQFLGDSLTNYLTVFDKTTCW
jgi:spermidine synthase